MEMCLLMSGNPNRTTYRTNAIRIALKDKATTKVMATCTSATPDKAAEPVYHHQSKHWMQPMRPQNENCTLSGYWEINGMKAHCL